MKVLIEKIDDIKELIVYNKSIVYEVGNLLSVIGELKEIVCKEDSKNILEFTNIHLFLLRNILIDIETEREVY